MRTAQVETLKRRGFDDTVSFPEVRDILGWTDGKVRRAVMNGEIVPVFWMESFGTRNAHYLDDGSPAHVLHGDVFLLEPTPNGGRDCYFRQAANFRIDGLNMAGLRGELLATRPAVGETSIGLDVVMAHGLVPLDQVAELLAQTTSAATPETAAPTSTPAVAVPAPVAAPVEVVSVTPKGVQKREMVKRHAARWPTIETDMKDAGTNGLAGAAKAGERGWREAAALDWAREKSRLLSAPEPGTIDAVMAGGFPSRQHKLAR